VVAAPPKSEPWSVVDEAYAALAASEPRPGAAFGLVADGRLAHVGAVGLADVETGRPVSAGTLFRIASMTKMVTALAVLMLRDDGAQALHDPAERHEPGRQ
jgi:D-alanyl-D-alanine-carboxypeptidase/D-alanyl-D-alanine-endopeptidase